jgi:putative ABC transport system permease protein
MREFRLIRNLMLGVRTLWLHKMRSLLTMLGVVFGVGSVISMLAVGEGAGREALEQIRALGSHNIIIDAAKPLDEEDRSMRVRMSLYGLWYQDEQRIAESFQHVRRTVPVKVIRKEGRMGTRSLEMRLVGTTPAWFDLVRREVLAGRVLQPRDERTHANVTVLTAHGARRLLAARESTGEIVRIGGELFEVVGIVRNAAGGGGMQTPDRETDAYIPLSTARERFGDVFRQETAGSSTRELVELHHIIAQVDDIAHVEATAVGISAMLARFHKNVDYRVRVPLALLRQAEATKRTFNIVLGSIAGISLLVGGIGIMNIMLASVTERTREIGIRRAIGAKRRQIVGQFLVESVVLSGCGGIIGVGIGILIPALVSKLSGMPTVVPLYSVFLSLGISVAVGIVFGIYPAIRAAHLDPIQALRHE